MSATHEHAVLSHREIGLGKNRLIAWLAFAAFALAGAALFFIPAFIIRPFRYQSPRALMLALEVRERAPWGTFVAAVICLVLALVLWSGTRKWRKAWLIVGVIVVSFSAVMSRLNYFEWMFHPIASPGFETETQSKLDPSEMVMAVRNGSDAKAYPISEMAYHHILNDAVNAVPIAVTY